jgi:hypothetical protein
MSDTSTPQAGSMVEMVVTGADLLRSGCSGNSAIGSQHKQQEPTKSADGLVGSRAKPPRGSKEHTASLQASVPPALEQMSQSQIEREDAEADAAGASALRGRGQVTVSDTSTPQAGSMVEMVVTGADLLRSGGSGNSAIGSQHNQQEPISGELQAAAAASGERQQQRRAALCKRAAPANSQMLLPIRKQQRRGNGPHTGRRPAQLRGAARPPPPLGRGPQPQQRIGVQQQRRAPGSSSGERRAAAATESSLVQARTSSFKQTSIRSHHHRLSRWRVNSPATK